MTEHEKRAVGFKAEDGAIVLAWSAEPGASWAASSQQTDAAFAEFPNVATPADLIRTYKNLGHPPIPPSYFIKAVEDVSGPSALLRAFGMNPTRKNTNEAKDTLAANPICASVYDTLPVSDCLRMASDMKALLTALLFSYGLCSIHALQLNTAHGFSFLCEQEEGASLYSRFIRNIREDDPQVLELDSLGICEDIHKAANARGGKPTRKTLDSIRRFAERYINAFMSSAHPSLHDGAFSPMSKNNTLGDIYAYWAQLACKGKAIACENCGKLVAESRKGQKYCSNSCKVQASQSGLTKK